MGTPEKIAERARRYIDESEKLAGWPDNAFPLMYALAWMMVENGATSKRQQDAAFRSISGFIKQIERNHSDPERSE